MISPFQALNLLIWSCAAMLVARPLLAVWPALALDPAIAALALLLLPPYALIAYALVQMSRFCRLVEAGAQFTMAAVRELTLMARALAAAAVALPVSRLLANSYAALEPATAGLAFGSLRFPVVLACGLGLVFALVLSTFAQVLRKSVVISDEIDSFL